MSEHDDYRDARRALADNQQNIAFLNGKVDQIYDGLRDDPEHIELLRNVAWAQTGRRMTLVDEKVTGAPEGWPEGVDPIEFVNEWTAARKAAATVDPEPGPDRNTPSAAVRKFREVIGK